MNRQEELNEMAKDHHKQARKGGYVYPQNAYPEGKGDWSGITRRDWLAGLAMQAMISNNLAMEKVLSSGEKFNIKLDVGVAIGAYRFADAMIAESNK